MHPVPWLLAGHECPELKKQVLSSRDPPISLKIEELPEINKA